MEIFVQLVQKTFKEVNQICMFVIVLVIIKVDFI